MNRSNPTSSTLTQILLDAQRLVSPQNAQLITQLLDGLTNRELTAVDDAFTRHQYPERALCYAKIPTIDHTPANYFGLSLRARDLLNFFARCVRNANYIQVKNAVLCNALDCNERSLQRAKKELLDNKIITIVTPAHGRVPDTISVSPAYTSAGKLNPAHDDTIGLYCVDILRPTDGGRRINIINWEGGGDADDDGADS